MTTLIVSLIIVVLFGGGVGLLVMEHVVARRQRRAFLGQLAGMQAGIQAAKMQVQQRVFDDIPIDRLFEALDNWWDNALEPPDPNNHRGNDE